MAEAIGIASGIAGLISLVGQITQLSYHYLIDLKDASKVQRRYFKEVSALTDVLLQLEEAVSPADALNTSPRLSSLLPSQRLEEYRLELLSLKEKLERRLQDKGTLSRIKSSFLWPLQEKETEAQISSLHRMHGTFATALTSHILTVSVITQRDVQDLKHEQIQRDLTNWLSAPRPTKSPTEILESVCPGTGQALLSHPDYLAWRDGVGTLLWCHGKPGVGKTTLAAIVIDDISAKFAAIPTPIIFHFCDFSNGELQNVFVLMTSLLTQFIPHPGNVPKMKEFHDNIQKTPSVPHLSKMLIEVCKLEPSRTLILDALDEFNDRRKLFPTLRDLTAAGVRICVTSRDLPDIRDGLNARHIIEIQPTESDIAQFVETTLNDSTNFGISPPQGDLINAIVDHVKGSFLLAKLMMDHLVDLPSQKQMKQALSSLPSELGEAYGSTFDRITRMQQRDRANLAKRVLGWITFSQRRLRVKELLVGLAVEPGSKKLDETNLTTVKMILSVCFGLVSVSAVDDSFVLIHSTAYEFLRVRLDDPHAVHQDIAEASMTYLSYTSLCDSDDELPEHFEAMPFLLYAALTWDYHASMVEDVIRPRIKTLLKDPHTLQIMCQAHRFWSDQMEACMRGFITELNTLRSG